MTNLSFNKATVELPEGTVTGARFLVRGTEAYMLDSMGRRTWQAVITDSVRLNRTTATITLASGEVINVTNDCGCSASKR